MRRRLSLLVAAALVVAFAPAAHAAPHPQGTTCGLAAVDDDTLTAPNTFTGVLFAGPLTLRDNLNPLVVYSGSIRCSIQVNSPLHSGVDQCAAAGLLSGGVAVLDPSFCSYAAGPSDSVYVCTQVDILGGPTLYHDAGGGWTTNANNPCNQVTAVVQCDPSTLPCAVKVSLLDPLLCPIFAIFFPPQGDIGIFWDCPPYSAPPPFTANIHALVPDVVT